MSNASSISASQTAEPHAELCDRKHRLTPPKSLLSRIGLALQDALESFVARVSVNGDLHIYDSRTFPWAAELEVHWQNIRDRKSVV